MLKRTVAAGEKGGGGKKSKKKREQQVEVVVGGRKKMLLCQGKLGAMKRLICQSFHLSRKTPFIMLNWERKRLNEKRPGMRIIITILKKREKRQEKKIEKPGETPGATYNFSGNSKLFIYHYK
ncbi:uncharacterized protein LOC135693870 [Rhopilema esculentum]|uniref:uncharacterized protein LOC135693870 n=1 Tax=Rhopilema esculentum TaxID=499914 RepID=UPI0031E1B638